MKSVVNKRILSVVNLLVVIFITISCEKEKAEEVVTPEGGDIYFPVGRISVMNNNLSIKSNIQDFIYELVYDSCGGYWLKFNSSQFVDNTKIAVDFTRTDQFTENFQDSTNLENWMKASYYIDCEEEAIINKALEITDGLSTNLEKAMNIHQYLIDNYVFVGSFRKPADVKASQTLEDGFGTCMNFSRLYVALCRASEIPARTIWGIVYSNEDDGIYDYHHQWAEICDEDGLWHICDLTYTKVFFKNNIKYLDLVYGAEENLSITGLNQWVFLLEDMSYWNSYPVAKGARLGFELIADNRPDAMVVEYTLEFD